MRLSQLVDASLGLCVQESYDDIEITGLSLDSRACQEGYLFAAFPGAQVDGRSFIPDAIAKGAVAVLTTADAEVEGAQKLAHADPRYVLGQLATRFFGKQPEHVAAVTGTNGKSSVVHFCRQLWTALGQQGACMGTLGVTEPDGTTTQYEGLTTPDVISTHKLIHDLAASGVNYLALEASSHGLDQWRLGGVQVQVGAMTNFTRDHLDYHGTFEAYLEAKLRLFDGVMDPGGTAVINADMEVFETVAERCKANSHQIVSFGKKASDFRLLDTKPSRGGQKIHFAANSQDYTLGTLLVGEFQASNLLCSMAILHANGFGIDDIVDASSSLTPVSGRMEKVATHPLGASVIIDYAHTPDALANALQSLRPYAEERLIVVFGCGGNRDKGKRAQMGEIAAKYADIVIITDDNPRNEKSSLIRSEIMKKCEDAIEIADREEAIIYAVNELKTGDLLLLSGKGHETCQIIGDERLPFDERIIVLRTIEAMV